MKNKKKNFYSIIPSNKNEEKKCLLSYRKKCSLLQTLMLLAFIIM